MGRSLLLVNISSKGSRRKLREPSKHRSPFTAVPVADGLPEAHPKVAKLQSDGGKQQRLSEGDTDSMSWILWRKL